MTALGLYRPGTSVLHRLPAGAKLVGLLAGTVLLVVLRRPWQLGLAALVEVLLYALARIPPGVAWTQLRPLRWLVVVVAAAQLLLAGWQQALWVTGGLVLTVALAALLTLTTRVTALLDVLHRLLRPLRRFGVDGDRVALLLALTIRLVPVLSGIVREVQEARTARGAGWSLTAVAAPAVVRALRTADHVGEALVARGVDD
ncbi:energy-coupling factor transporter transmembrane component T family protein [Nakamurella endophytica]|uniref:ABC transporter permease n=1 Tax=Nakamurella endophytica TaxID=1748367 RepID=A0A917WAB8_9ACTN|nr:energy-coupling factor transporter transmembrane protein EcfT [Nakamurella endophytica]GGL88269.1 ABC transporter permease [Nakamurella endophytica]